MTNRLAENIRVLRKERSLTQEQLAEVLGVTTGAVYKWEAKLSQPELNMVMELADFFDTSVDVLLGYEMKDNHLEKSVERLKQYRHEKNMDGLAEAEKSLKKYPNNFDIVYNSATLYRAFGIEKKDERLLKRALELYENSRLLVSQNTDFNINESILCGHIAEVLLSLGAVDKGKAPVVIAKGEDYLAAKIKEAARENNIEIVENKPLARMLYYNVELDEEIPPELYQAVAEVLAFVYNIKNKRT